MRYILGLVAAFALAGLAAGCGDAPQDASGLPPEQAKPDAGLDAAKKLMETTPSPGGRPQKSK